MNQLVVASHNQGKIAEISHQLAKHDIQVWPQSKFAVTEIAETAVTFVENALIKARHTCRHTGLPTLADDSGLEVDALHGQPGIYSARYAGEHASDQLNNQKLLRELESVPEDRRTARYQCVMVFLRHTEDPTPLICCGCWQGRILSVARGEGGFGYDPLFFVPELNYTAAEIPLSKKNTLSHRGQALGRMLPAIVDYFARQS